MTAVLQHVDHVYTDGGDVAHEALTLALGRSPSATTARAALVCSTTPTLC